MPNNHKISIVVPTYNEAENVLPMCEALIALMTEALPQYGYEIIFIDNFSTDGTREIIEGLCAEHRTVRAIFNARNFGQFNSPYHGICAATGDCVIPICADFQDPVELIPTLVAKWEAGYKVVCAVKSASKENPLMRLARTVYYKLMRRMSSAGFIEHFTGFGLYDKNFVEILKGLDDPTPFLRGIVAELGFRVALVPYEQQKRRAGRTHNSFSTLYDAALLSLTTYTTAPIRAMIWVGAVGIFAGLCLAAVFAIRGLQGVIFDPVWWLFALMCALFGILAVAVGILGEYLLLLRGKLLRRPLVVEERRISFEHDRE